MRSTMDLILAQGSAPGMNRKLTQDQAQSILHRVAAGESQKNLAHEYGVEPSTVSSLVSGRTWPELERPPEPEVRVRGAKLGPEDIQDILRRLAAREKAGDIAEVYQVTRQTIANIRRGKTWGHIPRPEPVKPRRVRVWEQD